MTAYAYANRLIRVREAIKNLYDLMSSKVQSKKNETNKPRRERMELLLEELLRFEELLHQELTTILHEEKINCNIGVSLRDFFQHVERRRKQRNLDVPKLHLVTTEEEKST